MKRYRRLTVRLTAFNVLLGGAIMVLGLSLVLLYAQSQLERRNQGDFRDAVASLVFYADNETIISQSYLEQMEIAHSMAIYIEDNRQPFFWKGVVSLQGQREALLREALAHAEAQGLSNLSPPLRSDGLDFSLSMNGNVYRASVYVLVHGQSALLLAAVQDTLPEREALLQSLAFFSGAVSLSLLLFALASYFFARRAVRPLQEAHRQQAEFVQAASHELRTPLAALSASVSALERASAEERPRFMESIARETLFMTRLLDSMLTLAGKDADMPAALLPVEIGETAENALRDMESLAASKGISLLRDIPARLPLLEGDELALTQLLRIVVDNAIEYSPENSAVRLRVSATAHHIALEIADEGLGIPDAHKEDVFLRFYRMDKARARERAHYGLGLAIAKEIVLRHRGRIGIRDNHPQGAVFVIQLPLR